MVSAGEETLVRHRPGDAPCPDANQESTEKTMECMAGPVSHRSSVLRNRRRPESFRSGTRACAKTKIRCGDITGISCQRSHGGLDVSQAHRYPLDCELERSDAGMQISSALREWANGSRAAKDREVLPSCYDTLLVAYLSVRTPPAVHVRDAAERHPHPIVGYSTHRHG